MGGGAVVGDEGVGVAGVALLAVDEGAAEDAFGFEVEGGGAVVVEMVGDGEAAEGVRGPGGMLGIDFVPDVVEFEHVEEDVADVDVGVGGEAGGVAEGVVKHLLGEFEGGAFGVHETGGVDGGDAGGGADGGMILVGIGVIFPGAEDEVGLEVGDVGGELGDEIGLADEAEVIVAEGDDLDAGIFGDSLDVGFDFGFAAGDDGPGAIGGDGLDDGDAVTVAGGFEHGAAHAVPVIVDVGANDEEVEFVHGLSLGCGWGLAGGFHLRSAATTF